MDDQSGFSLWAFKDLHEGHEELPKRARRQLAASKGPPGLRRPVVRDRPRGMPGVSQGAFVCFLRPQGAFVSLVERRFVTQSLDDYQVRFSAKENAVPFSIDIHPGEVS